MNRAAVFLKAQQTKNHSLALLKRIKSITEQIPEVKTKLEKAKQNYREDRENKVKELVFLRFEFQIRQLRSERKRLEAELSKTNKLAHQLELKSITNKQGTLVHQPFAALKLGG